MLVALADIKTYLGINNTPVILNFNINATANTLTRATGDWAAAGVVIGSQLLLAGFSNATNNVVVTVSGVTALVLTISEIATMVTETGNSLCSYRIEKTTYDTFLTEQEEIISQAVESYCGRKFLSAAYVQKYYIDDYLRATQELTLFHYPLITLTSVLEDTTNITADVRPQSGFGRLFYRDGFFRFAEMVQVTYTAGFATLPAPLKSVILSLVEERYNKKVSGVPLNFGSDVQSISIPGTISVAFDYSLQANERKIKFGTILGNYVNALDYYRSERAIVGSGTISYVA